MPEQPAGRDAQPPDPAGCRTLDELAAVLRALKAWAGDPSYDTITRRVNAAHGPAGRGTVVDCFRAGRRRVNPELVVAVAASLHDDEAYLGRWRQAIRVTLAERQAAANVRVLAGLPGEASSFVGREPHLAALERATGVCVITGMAGVGKTRLAVHAGHRRTGTRLFVDLRGFHPDDSQPPADPGAVLDGFLRALGVPPRQIPHDLGARSALFRDQVAGRQALVVLDNAADEEQVRPLLAPDVLTLVTSRRELNGLGPATRIDLDVFSSEEASELLAGAVPVDGDAEAVERVAQRCGYLPLALTVVAGQMTATPGWSVADHADRLDERHRNHRLDDGVQLALHLSDQGLPERRRTLLRRLAGHPGQDLDAYAAAALLDAELDETEEHLRRLAAEHLIQQPVPGRFVLHDLVRAYAAERSADEERPADRRAALTRLFDLYLYAASAAMDALHPAEKHRRPALDPHDVRGPDLSDSKAALHWLDTERATLVAVCLYAARNGWESHAVRLAATLYTYLDNGGYPADAIAVHSEARHAAARAGDLAGEANALVNLAVVHWQLGRHPEALEQLTEALALFRRLGDRRGQARALGNLGVVHNAFGDHAESAAHHALALEQFAAIGDRVGEANTLTNLGDVYVRMGRAQDAAEHHRRALTLFRDLNHRGGEATALTNLGDADTRLGNHTTALDSYDKAVAIFGELGERYGQTCALNGRGEALLAAGRNEEALTSFKVALGTARLIDDPAEQARSHAGLAAVFEAAGDTAAAARHRPPYAVDDPPT
ncbi:tetratricopeptide repeat protein [Paractinoplanes brasiliensis]|uniref:NB-ARC domain-containing protein n=1 Tax=Paractinoplanes brasiliensis TaxID=52695 RepID=A0A4R6JU98_9ACTN|nr:tetratricopeptide repeat protein [Actinoplanes brasiliensis]TDO38225.1 NB-ARC domain-containing protein [Actinoplanes brasiliensis]